MPMLKLTGGDDNPEAAQVELELAPPAGVGGVGSLRPKARVLTTAVAARSSLSEWLVSWRPPFTLCVRCPLIKQSRIKNKVMVETTAVRLMATLIK